MINHFRTLLVNREAQPSYSPGAVYCDPTFKPVALPGYLSRLHGLLFPEQADNLFVNLRAYELLQIVHSTKLSEFVTEYDKRLTYDLSNIRFDNLFVDSLKELTNTNSNLIFNSASIVLPNGITTAKWGIDAADTASIYITQHLPSPIKIALDEPKFNFMFIDDSAKWELTVCRRPVQNVASLLTSLNNSGADWSFLDAATAEPMLTFKRIRDEHPIDAYKLAASLCAIVFQIDALRESNA